MLKPTLISSTSLLRGRIIEVCTEVLRYANGREHAQDLVRHPGAAAVVAVDGSNRACFVRQYRNGIEDFLWEIPAGKMDRGEAPFDCAVRELAEETG
ncbi:MAG TPA: NUDIX hydrolase, partial [Steroidobacteraceae bacterium]|nr:NUDIX hydrolase [Steroidobacteraceae bacterium]